MSLSVNKPKVLVIGHSFIRRPESWMERTKSDLSSTIDTKLHGVGRRQVHSLKHFDLDVVKNFEPEWDMVFLQIGENDICHKYSASHTASEIIQLAKHIRRMGVSTVVLGSNIIRPTPRNMKETTYDKK